MTTLAAVYHGALTPASQNYNRGTSPTAYPLPPDLQPYYDAIVNLSKKTGYAYFRLKWVLSKEGWGIPRWKFYRIIRKLQYFGRLMVEEVPGSHHRYFHPIPLRKKKAGPPVDTGENKKDAPPAEKPDLGGSSAESGDAAPAPVSSTPEKKDLRDAAPISLAAQLLVSRGIDPKKAVEATDGVPLRDVQDALAAYDFYASANEIRVPERAILKAIRDNWKPPTGKKRGSPVTDDPGEIQEEIRTVLASPLPGIDIEAVESAAAKIPALASLLSKYGRKKNE